jgi:hypothetical protein
MTFDVARVRVDPLPAITNIFLNHSISRETLEFVISCFPEKVPIDFYVDLVNMGDDLAALKAAGIISTFFPDISNNDWNTLVSLTDNVEDEEYENPALRSFFISKAADSVNHVVPPSWIIPGLSSPKIHDIPIDIPSVSEAVDLILDDLKTKNINFNTQCDCDDEEHDHDTHHDSNNLRDTIISQYAISTITEKIQMLSEVKHLEPFDDRLLFQEYGPVNTVYTVCKTNIDPDHICSKHGGCRMFLCSEFEQIQTDGTEIDLMTCEDHSYAYDWFRGSCDTCSKRIAKRHYALRMPNRYGGWSGCYCSFECIESNITDPHVALMVGRIKEQLEVIGIRERT